MADKVIVRDLFELTAGDLLSGSQTRLMAVGGAGSLYVNKEHTAQSSDSPDSPDMFKPLAAAMAKQGSIFWPAKS